MVERACIKSPQLTSKKPRRPIRQDCIFCPASALSNIQPSAFKHATAFVSFMVADLSLINIALFGHECLIASTWFWVMPKLIKVLGGFSRSFRVDAPPLTSLQYCVQRYAFEKRTPQTLHDVVLRKKMNGHCLHTIWKVERLSKGFRSLCHM